MVAIVAHRRPDSKLEHEINALADAYRSLRGGTSRQSMSAGGFARIITVTSETSGDAQSPSDLLTDASGSWAVAVGAPHCLQRPGVADLSALDGQFIWISFDAARETLSIATDPFGMQALYMAERAGKIYLSSCALALATHLRATPSQLGLNTYLRVGYQFGAVTNWEGVERLDPATRVSFNRDGVTNDVYWRPTVDDAVTRLNLADASRYCTDVATDAYRRCFDRGPRAWTDLTGGYDSRLLALLLQRAGVDFAVNTVGSSDNPDVRIAESIAAIAGWDWSRFDIPRDWHEVLPRLIAQSVGWGDCHLDALQLAEVLWGHASKRSTHPLLFNGGGGEHFQSYAWQQEFLNVGRSDHVNLDNWVNMMMMKPVSTYVFASDPTPEVRDNLHHRMATYGEPYRSHLNTVQLDILYAYKSTGHFGAYASAAAGLLQTELPFYLRPVFSAAFSTSHRHRIGHRLMRHMMQTLSSRIAAVTTMKGGPAQPMRLTNAHRFLPYYGLIGRKAVSKISERVLRHPLLLPPASADPVRARARGALVDGLDDGRPLRAKNMRSAALYKQSALEELLSRAGDPSLQDAALLQRILTVELALRATDASVDA